MEDLYDLETILLNGLIQKYPTLATHIPLLKVSERHITKTGMTVNFEYTNSAENVHFEDINALFSGEENIAMKGLKHGLGYVIDVTEGKIIYLEFVTYGETWNGKFGEYKIIRD